MILIACFSFQPPKKKNENEFAIRAAALAARRSGARLAPVSPPAALPTILTRNTREKQKNPKNRASSPEDPAQTLPLHGFVLGGRYARLVQQRLGVPQRVARPRRRRRRRRGRGRGRGHGWRTREWPAGWPAGARGGNFGIGLGDGVRRGRFLGLRRGAFAKGLAFAPRFFSCVFLRAAARGRRRRRRGEGRAPFLFLFLIGRLRKLRLYLPRLRRIRGEVVHRNRGAPPRPARRRRRGNDAPLRIASRAAVRRKNAARAARLRAPSETIPRIRRLRFFPFPSPDRLRLSLQNLGLQNEVDRRERVRGEARRRRARVVGAHLFFFHWGFRS